MFKRNGAVIKVDKEGKIVVKANMSNNQISTAIRILSKFLLLGENTKFTVEQVLSGLSMNLDYQKLYGYCKYCNDEYPNMKYQGFKFCPHCGSKLYEGKL